MNPGEKKTGRAAGAAAQVGAERALPPGWLEPLRNRRSLLILLALLVAGALLRGLYLSEFVRYPDFRVPHVDADYHNYWARGLAFGQWTPPAGNPDPMIRTTPYFRPPGYPYFLALVYKLTGPGYTWPRILQMLLGLLNVFLAFLLAARYSGRAAALLWAGMMATYWIFIFYEGEFQEPVLMTLLVLLLATCLMAWSERPTLRQSLAAGALVGLAGLIRPNSLLLLPAVIAWMHWVHRRTAGPKALDRARLRRLGAHAAAVCLAAGLLLLPATLRNWIVAHDFVPISTNGGINLYIGNNGRADGIVRGALPDIGVLDTCYDWPEIVDNVGHKVGRPLSHSEVSSYFTRGAERWMLGHPLGVADLIWKKTLLFWGPLEPQDNKEVDEDRKASLVLRFLPWSFATALGLGTAGALLVLWRKREKRSAKRLPEEAAFGSLALLFGLVVLVWYLSYLPFAVTSRYRVPVIPVLLFFASLLVLEIVRSVAARNFRGSGLWLGLAALCLIPAHINFAGYKNSPARWHYQRGTAYTVLGKPEDAIREFESALREDPRYVSVYNDLGAILASSHRLPESIPCFRKSLELNPRSPQAHANLAAALELTGQLEESLKEYRESLRWRPGNPQVMEGIRRVSAALAGRATSAAPAPR
jgi:4-amino-4-deoxy-L-arabinose transferase-like glycosyltransferase